MSVEEISKTLVNLIPGLSILMIIISSILFLFFKYDDEFKYGKQMIYISTMMLFLPFFFKKDLGFICSMSLILLIIFCYILCNCIKCIIDNYNISKKYDFNELYSELFMYEVELIKQGYLTIWGDLRIADTNKSVPGLIFSKDNINWYVIALLRNCRDLENKDFRIGFSYGIITEVYRNFVFADTKLTDENLNRLLNYTKKEFIEMAQIRKSEKVKLLDNLILGTTRSGKGVYINDFVSREELRKIMNILPTEYLYDEEDIALAQDYLERLRIIKKVLPNAIEHNLESIQTIKLTQRQEHLSDVILKYAIDSTYDRRDYIYHELYDFIDNRADEREYLSYAEIVVLRILLNCIIDRLEKEILEKGE